MNRISFLFFIFITSLVSQAQTPAFPGAGGGGMYTTGDRGGKVLYVTSLDTNYSGKNALDINEKGFTYLEVYLNSLINKITENENAGARN